MRTSFIITKCFLSDPNNSKFLKSEISKKTESMIYKFRLRDADNIVYFEGLSRINNSFDPKDEFGENYGCTDIQYLKNNRWGSL